MSGSQVRTAGQATSRLASFDGRQPTSPGSLCPTTPRSPP